MSVPISFGGFGEFLRDRAGISSTYLYAFLKGTTTLPRWLDDDYKSDNDHAIPSNLPTEHLALLIVGAMFFIGFIAALGFCALNRKPVFLLQISHNQFIYSFFVNFYVEYKIYSE